MCIYSRFWIEWEKENLAPYAVLSEDPWYTQRNDDNGSPGADKDPLDRFGSRSRYRTVFEIDKDRITNSQAFRRLEYKTQVFVTHEGDNYRTRLTHSLEVSEIARHIARSLRLNEHLVEAIALGHDLGHAPYGHIAERAINEWINNKANDLPLRGKYYFCHNRNSVEVVEHLEPGYDWDNRDRRKDFAQGLNLTKAVREGILVHTSMGYRGEAHLQTVNSSHYEDAIKKLSASNRVEKKIFYPGTLEAQVVRVSDDIAQRIHDLEDGLRSNMISKKDICDCIGEFFSEETDVFFQIEFNFGKRTPLKKIDSENDTETATFDRRRDITRKRRWQIRTGQKVMYMPKAFLHQVVMLAMDNMNGTEKSLNYNKHFLKVKFDYKKLQDNIHREINEWWADKDYQRYFTLAAKIAFLLHMWRSPEDLSILDREEQHLARSRVLKYLMLLLGIMGLGQNNIEPPAYHIVAFLRGIMLANVIEHSFWHMHSLLDSRFRSPDQEGQHTNGFKSSKPVKKIHDGFFYLFFVVVDGLTEKTNGEIKFQPAEEDSRIYCFRFDKKKFKTIKKVLEKFKPTFEKIIASNGTCLPSLMESDRFIKARRVIWLNKSQEPVKTQRVHFDIEENGKYKPMTVLLENIRIFFTGYKDLCPSVHPDTCQFNKQFNTICDICPYHSKGTRHADINRLIQFDDYLRALDDKLRKLISQKLHNSSRIARMNYMGKKVILHLLNAYLENPRLMHDRVWSRLRCYKDMPEVSPSIRNWQGKPIYEREATVIGDDIYNPLTGKAAAGTEGTYKCNQYSLVRRIIEHLSGMTDRYIINEYNRLTQGGREVEMTDETYFFS